MINCTKITLCILFSIFILSIFFYDKRSLQLILFLIAAFIIAFYCFLYTLEIDEDDLEIDNVEIEIVPNHLISIKVNNIEDLHPNFNEECCICLELIDPINSFKLSNCDYHIFHEECINSYIENNFTRCPVCNI